MKPTLLLDLDDTLLVNDIEAFIPVYLQRFSQEVAAVMNPELFVKALWAGTRAMMANRQPDCTLREVFESVFYPMVGSIQGTFQPIADRFYAEVFPTLREFTRFRPEAVELVEQARQAGYRLVVATNPLFPIVAILHRLEWAGFPADRFPFELVSSYETFHFTKDQPAYYCEILGRLGWPEGPVVMVGDDWMGDIQSAARAGLASFWITNGRSTQPTAGDLSTPSASGKLEDLLLWLKATPEDGLIPRVENPPAILASLRATAAVIDTLCRGLPEEKWKARQSPEEWSPVEVLCHLRDVDLEVNLPRLIKVIQEQSPFIPAVDSDPWAHTRAYILQDPGGALQGFFQARQQLLDFLEKLAPEDWQRTCRHAIFGPTSLAELAGITAAHDRIHVRQFQKLLA